MTCLNHHKLKVIIGLAACALMCWPHYSQAQEMDPIADSIRMLDELVVKAYRSDRPLSEVPATISILDPKVFDRFSNASIVSAVNTIPGVRMEERSPGSYRFSMRGSLLRSPFGIRNVKFYWKGLPYTDGGGNTYFNSLDQTLIGRMEIIKGPGASLYGAGTGGVVLMDAPFLKRNEGNYNLMTGSYGLFKFDGVINILNTKKSSVDIAASLFNSKGYREQSALKRTSTSINWNYDINNKNTFALTVLSSQLHYETPGGLNATQFAEDPRQARQRAGTIPGAVEQKAAINNATLYAGGVYQHFWSNRWSTSVGMYGSFTDFKNPAILNYEAREESNVGGRTETQYRFEGGTIKGKLTFGAEHQYFRSPITVYDNQAGQPGNVRTEDKLWSRSWLAFSQVELDLPRNFLFTIGASANFLKYDFIRYGAPDVEQQRKFDGAVYPRVALLKKVNKELTVYGSVSEGFSAPTLAEVRPSTGNFNADLKPEQGTSIEAGVRGEHFNRTFKYNVALYNFRLNETIVVQSRSSDGADFFQNAGRTAQYGIEATASWEKNWGVTKPGNVRLWGSYTYNDYRFKNYVNNGNDFSGNKVTGIPPVVLGAGLDLVVRKWYGHITMNYTDHIPLNDQSSEFASAYTLLGIRAGFRHVLRASQFLLEPYLGVDNLFDARYSLGNDLNAAGTRYYNPAAGRNFYIGLRFKFNR